MEKKIQRKRFLASFITIIFLISFLAISPQQHVLAATNLAAGKIATSSTSVTNISRVTDGLKDTNTYYDMTTGLQWVQLDLGASYNLSDIKVWHYFADARKYHDVVVRVSNSSTFASGVTTVFNNDTNNSAGFGTGTGSEYAETSTGKDIPVASVNARYVRLYSNGSSVNAYNHYVEVEVYGSAVNVGSNLAAGKIAASSTDVTDISLVTDGIKDTNSYYDMTTGVQWIQLDLGASYNLTDIKLWHYFADARKYHDVVVQVSNDST